jgi:hypothetical protein
MIDALIETTERLCDVLMAENEALEALDLPAAGALAAEKGRAATALQAIYLAVSGAGAKADGDEEAAALRAAIDRLALLTRANTALVEQGLALQMKLMRTIARAVPLARAAEAPVYQADGSQLPPRPPEAYAFESRM